MPAIIAALPNHSIILAAGGIANGQQAAAFLVLGAAGVVLGTRFLLCPESLYNNAQRQALLAAGHTSTVRTAAFDQARGTNDWPPGVDGRALYNLTVKDLDDGIQLTDVQRLFKEGVKAGDKDRMLVWAGTGVGLMTEIKPASVRGILFAIQRNFTSILIGYCDGIESGYCSNPTTLAVHTNVIVVSKQTPDNFV